MNINKLKSGYYDWWSNFWWVVLQIILNDKEALNKLERTIMEIDSPNYEPLYPLQDKSKLKVKMVMFALHRVALNTHRSAKYEPKWLNTEDDAAV